MRKKVIFFAISLFVADGLFGQNTITESYLRNNTIKINSIAPSDTIFWDLDDLGKSIGESRIVFLGEQTHGDGATFLAKTRLVKYLHEKMGFDVLAFESGFYEVNAIWRNAVKTKALDLGLLRGGVYGVWGLSQQMSPLFEYINDEFDGKNPLITTGFDCRHFSGYVTAYYPAYLEEVLSSVNLLEDDINIEYVEFMSILQDLLTKEYKHKVKKKEKEKFFSYLDKIERHVENNGDRTFFLQEIKSLRAAAKNAWAPIAKDMTLHNIRDVQMADNLLWLIDEKYPQKKIIVWVANYHLIQDAKSVNTQRNYDGDKVKIMGEQVVSSLTEPVYNIAFTSFEGEFSEQFEGPYPIDSEPEESLEKMMSKLGYNYGFLDFKRSNLKEPFNMRAIGHFGWEGQWNQAFDGVFFIKTMTPSTILPQYKKR